MIRGIGAVSPAGWGVECLREAITSGEPAPAQDLARPGASRPLSVRRVPSPVPRPAFLADARLRRSPPIAQFVVGAALEALGEHRLPVVEGAMRLGIVICTMCGCVRYTGRFYDEILHQPALASPLLFPETVFNASGSHLAALLNSAGPNYTLIGDQGSVGVGMAIAVDWLLEGEVEGCLVIGAEELDWMMADAMGMFSRRVVLSEGAGALYLELDRNSGGGTMVAAIASPHLYRRELSRETCSQRMRAELPAMGSGEMLCDGGQGAPRVDGAEARVWQDWSGPRISPKNVLGEALAAAALWQVVAAADMLGRDVHRAATISLVGCNQQASGIRLQQI